MCSVNLVLSFWYVRYLHMRIISHNHPLHDFENVSRPIYWVGLQISVYRNRYTRIHKNTKTTPSCTHSKHMIIGWIEIRAYQNHGRALCNMMRWCFLKIPLFTVFKKNIHNLILRTQHILCDS